MLRMHDIEHVRTVLHRQKTLNANGKRTKNKDIKLLEEDLFTSECNKVNIEIRNSQEQSELYHFKVM